jgi:FdhE protein
MSKTGGGIGGGAGGPWNEPVPIGEIAAPPFVRLPDPLTLFARRAERFRELAAGHELGPYLRFLADLSACQHGIQHDLPEPELPAGDARELAYKHGMPAIDRSQLTADAALDATLDRLFAAAAGVNMPATARAALTRAGSADAAARGAMVHAVLADAIPVEMLAEHVYVAAALQVHFARLATRLDPQTLAPVGEGGAKSDASDFAHITSAEFGQGRLRCPACGDAPVASSIVGWKGAHGARFCACSLCATQWHVVRIKCVLCSSTKGIGYQELDGGAGVLKAETCEECRGYVKILHQHANPALDPVADDVAGLGLDLLLREKGYRRGAVNPFLLGY